MSEQPPRPPDGPRTTWDWDTTLGVWVEREKTAEELSRGHATPPDADQPPPVEPVDTPAPPNTTTTTWDRTVQTVDGVPTVVWVERPWTPEELAENAALEARRVARETVRAIVNDLQAEKDRAQAVIDNPNSTARERDLGRACKRIADAVIDLARYVG